MLEHHADLRTHFRDGAVGMRAEHAADLVAIHGFAVDFYAAALGDLQVVDAAQQRRFAAAGRADDADHLADGDRQVDPSQYVQRAKMLVQVFDLDHRPSASGGHVVHGTRRLRL